MTHSNRKLHFRSRVSVLLIVILLLALIPALLAAVKQADATSIYMMLGTILFVFLIMTGIRYTIADEVLYIKVCLIPAGRIPVADIVSVKRSYNALSSPAASLKRLRIDYRGGKWSSFALISPVDEERFVAELKRINDRIYVSVDNKKKRGRIWDWDL